MTFNIDSVLEWSFRVEGLTDTHPSQQLPLDINGRHHFKKYSFKIIFNLICKCVSAVKRVCKNLANQRRPRAVQMRHRLPLRASIFLSGAERSEE